MGTNVVYVGLVDWKNQNTESTWYALRNPVPHIFQGGLTNRELQYKLNNGAEVAIDFGTNPTGKMQEAISQWVASGLFRVHQ